MNYPESLQCLLLTLRKAPETQGKFFRLQAEQLKIIIELLMGDIPDRALFESHEFKIDLQPYFEVVVHVREGDLEGFKSIIAKYTDRFERDDNLFLINRLRHNVIKFGLRKINLSYSRISLEDIRAKLGLESVKETECIVSKAIRGGVINAVIDHSNSYLTTRKQEDVYTSNEPQKVFDRRIRFCLEMSN